MKKIKVSILVMMVGIALIAIVFGVLGKNLSDRRQAYLYDAAFHERRELEESRNLAVLDHARRDGAINVNEPSILKLEKTSQLRVLYHGKLKNKYKRAASHPWESVSPDPKEPGEAVVRASMYMTKDVPQL